MMLDNVKPNYSIKANIEPYFPYFGFGFYPALTPLLWKECQPQFKKSRNSEMTILNPKGENTLLDGVIYRPLSCFFNL